VFSEQPSFLVTAEELLPLGEPCRELWAVVEGSVAERLRDLGESRGRAPHDPARMFAVWVFAMLEDCPSTRTLETRCRHDNRYQYLTAGTRPDHTTLARWFLRFEDVLDEAFGLVLKAARGRGLVHRQLAAVDGTRLAAARTQWRAAHAGLEPEAQTIKAPHGYLVGYNAQAAVDAQSGFVTGHAVVCSPNDMNALEAVLASMPEPVEAVAADAGYDTSANLHAAAVRGVTAFVNPDGRERPPFTEGPDGVLRCPAGHVPYRVSHKKRKAAVHTYRVKRCPACPLRPACNPSGSPKGLTVAAGADPRLKYQNDARSKTPEGQAALATRGPTVERFFAVVKGHRGFKRFRRSGARRARLEWQMVCLCHNLGLLARLSLARFGRFSPVPRARALPVARAA
jgi:transposase